jgi:hypothetical protein
MNFINNTPNIILGGQILFTCFSVLTILSLLTAIGFAFQRKPKMCTFCLFIAIISSLFVIDYTLFFNHTMETTLTTLPLALGVTPVLKSKKSKNEWAATQIELINKLSFQLLQRQYRHNLDT